MFEIEVAEEGHGTYVVFFFYCLLFAFLIIIVFVPMSFVVDLFCFPAFLVE